MRFASTLREPAFAARHALRWGAARTLARELFAVTRKQFGRAHKGSRTKLAKLRDLERNAAVVLGSVG